ncbi:MAG: hypothetical protein WCI27_03565 [Candidatus Omnitrophota bacterium]
MIPHDRLRESGFLDDRKFPRELVDHEIELSLPSAIEYGVTPLRVRVERGLVIPLQVAGSSNGTVIRRDGAILHVGHQESGNPASPLAARFIRDIPYDLRVEISNIMRRALQVDPSLKSIWDDVRNVWLVWFPAGESVDAFKFAGSFDTADQAWLGMAHLIGQLVERFEEHAPVPVHVKIRVAVQGDVEFKEGWSGEELLVSEAAVTAVITAGWINYVKNFIFPGLRQVLASPVFQPRSTFKLYYGNGGTPTVKLVVVPWPGHDAQAVSSAGIELNHVSRDAFKPPVRKEL